MMHGNMLRNLSTRDETGWPGAGLQRCRDRESPRLIPCGGDGVYCTCLLARDIFMAVMIGFEPLVKLGYKITSPN